MNDSKRLLIPILLFLSTGLLAGSALPELLHMGTGSYAGFTSLYSFQHYKTISVRPWDLFQYVVSVRLPILLFLWMSSFTAAGLLFHLLYAWWLLASAAMLLAVFELRSGAFGILLFACCLFPQWLLYALVWKREVAAWIRRGRRFPELAGSVGQIRRGDLLELGGLLLLCAAGCACEAFLGTWTLQLFLSL